MATLDLLTAILEDAATFHATGEVAVLRAGELVAGGAPADAAVGDAVRVAAAGRVVAGRIHALEAGRARITLAAPARVTRGARVVYLGRVRPLPGAPVLGRVVDPSGRPVGEDAAVARAPAEKPALVALGDNVIGTGLAVFDALFPVAPGDEVHVATEGTCGVLRLLSGFARAAPDVLVVMGLAGRTDPGPLRPAFLRGAPGRFVIVVEGPRGGDAVVSAAEIAARFASEGRRVLAILDLHAGGEGRAVREACETLAAAGVARVVLAPEGDLPRRLPSLSTRLTRRAAEAGIMPPVDLSATAGTGEEGASAAAARRTWRLHLAEGRPLCDAAARLISGTGLAPERIAALTAELIDHASDPDAAPPDPPPED